jgi:DNA-binding transcriptional MerR regulator
MHTGNPQPPEPRSLSASARIALDARARVTESHEPQRALPAAMSKKDRPISDAKQDKVIHVIFGPGGGRVEASAPNGDATKRTLLGDPLPPSGREPVSDMFTGSEVQKLLGLSTGRLRSLDRAGIVSPTGRRKGRRAYTFGDIIALRAARDLLARKVRLRDVARAIGNIRASLPKVTRPLAELRIVSDGQRVVVKSATGTFEPLTGQMVLDFDVKDLRDDVVRVLRPFVGRERARTAYDLYVRASQLDEDPATMEEAESLYRRALELDPWLAIAYTNLGNICFRRNDEEQAEALYRRALELDAVQPEAQYNLGYVMLERGEATLAINYFQGAIASDPRFADAYFNLAMAYEQVGDAAKARPCWRKYLEIEPTGTWADIARRHL